MQRRSWLKKGAHARGVRLRALMEGEGEAKAWDRLTSETSPLGVCVGQSLSALHGPFSDAPDRGNTSREACALLTAEECARGCVRVCVRTRT